MPVIGNVVNMFRASAHDDWGAFAMFTGFLVLDAVSVGTSELATYGFERALVTAGQRGILAAADEAIAAAATRVVTGGAMLLTREGITSFAGQVMERTAINAAIGAGISGIASYSRGEGFFAGAATGLAQGLIMGPVDGAVGWFFNPTCFAAGTEVVTGVEYLDEEESGEVIVRAVTAKRLSQMGKTRRLATLEKVRLKIIRYMTCAIELLKAGDWVLTRDESDAEGELILRQIEEKFERTAYNLLFLTIRSSSGQTQTLTTTNEHPVYVEGLGWIEAIDLEPGQEVLEPDGGKSTVIATRHERHLEGVAVYNFLVNECHTYFVREQGSQAEPVWVHNAEYGIGRYGRKALAGEQHHGILDAWAKANFPRYVSRASSNPAIELSAMNHGATKGVFRQWLKAKYGRPVGVKVDWRSISYGEAIELSERMFDAAKVPFAARRDYYAAFLRDILLTHR